MTGKDKLELIKHAMTPVQWGRYRLYLKGWTLTEIAEKEGVCVQSVSESIKRGENRAESRLKTLKNP